jgi:putative transposase
MALRLLYRHLSAMGRERRIHEAGHIYHVTAHGIDDRPIFHDDIDRTHFVNGVSRVVQTYRLRCYALCLMSTHYHFLVGLREPNLADAMRQLNGSYSRRFNSRHGRRGALFESRYRDTRIADDKHLFTALRYIALNPVPAVADQPSQWPWSTYGQLIGECKPWRLLAVPLVLSHFSPRRDEAVRQVRSLVEGF